MMSFKSYFFQVSSILVVVFLFMIMMTTSNASETTIKDICSKTRFLSYCLQVLESTPGAVTADLKSLATITIHFARSNATSTLYRIRSLIPKTADPKLKEIYKSCSEEYDEAICDLEDAEADFKKGDYNGMNVLASGAITEAGDCGDETVYFAVDPSIKKSNQNLDHICGIILVVANLLAGMK